MGSEESGQYSGPAISNRTITAPQAEPPRWPWLTPGLLVFANLIPLAGVVLGGWDVGLTVLFYWAENLIVGAINLFKLLSYLKP